MAAAIEFLVLEGMTDPNVPKRNLPCDFDSMSTCEKQKAYHNMVQDFVRTYLNLTTIAPPPASASKDRSEATPSKSVDGVREYARDVLSLTLLEHEFHDATKEGDGERVLRVWKILLLLFKASGNHNYAIEAITLMAQYHAILPPRLAQQLIWGRFINTHNKPGCNIPCDLHLEHRNRTVKTAVQNLGANTTPKAITRMGKCVGPIMKVCSHFDSNTTVT